MKNLSIIHIIMGVCLFLVFAAYNFIPELQASSQPDPTGGYSAVDSTGSVLYFNQKPQRIISLTISTDEILIDLVPPERIVALSYLADDSGISNIVEKSKTIKHRVDQNSAEAIVALQPDLVIVADFFSKEMIQTLRDLNLNVYVYKTQSDMASVKASIREIAQLVGEAQNAEAIIGMMDDKLNELHAKLSVIPVEQRKRVVYARTNGITFREKSSFHDICKFGGVRDATLELTGVKQGTLSKEEVVRLNPDAFVLADWNHDGKHYAAQACQEIKDDPAYQTIKAIRMGKVIPLPGAHMQALSHYIVYAAEDMAKAMYPELF